MNINEINKDLLKEKFKELIKTVKKQKKENIFLEGINEVFIEEWLNDEEEDLLLTNVFSSSLITSLRDKIGKEIDSKYVKSSSKLSILISAFLGIEVIEKTLDSTKEEIEKNSNILAGVKEIIDDFEKEEGENW